MKKTLFTLFVLIAGFATQMFAMSTSSIRTNARFISDRMAYELDLSPAQYDDVYEINYDFIYAINRIMDDVAWGYGDAINRYYNYLDDRNEDMRYVLTARQYVKFMSNDYFYRPVYTYGRKWNFRIYTIYSNRNFFYFDAPRVYKSYSGGHSAKKYYESHHKHEIHKESAKINGSKNFDNHSRNDFGTVRRDRNDKQKNSINNYKNPNQQNRTQDSRYQDKSGNKNSPEINHRQNNQQQPSTTQKQNTTPKQSSTRTQASGAGKVGGGRR